MDEGLVVAGAWLMLESDDDLDKLIGAVMIEEWEQELTLWLGAAFVLCRQRRLMNPTDYIR